jgi:thiol:disulfide interchange protein DsbC
METALKSILWAACAALLFPLNAPAQENSIEARIKQGVETRMGSRVTSITKTPYLGLYEVFHEGEVLYTDENLSVFMLGPMIDGNDFRNVTAERLQKLMAIDFSELPLKLAIKQVRGSGKHVFASFEDPNCGFCKKLAKEMSVLDNVTIYTFLYPILSQDSLDKSKMIWCSKDRVKAWNGWMIDGKAPVANGDCDTSAIQKTREIGQRLMITGTPTLFFLDGRRVPGAMSIERLKQMLFGGEGAAKPAVQKPKTTEAKPVKSRSAAKKATGKTEKNP